MTLPPQFLKDRTIGGMFPGETGWTTPWSMSVHEDRTCVLKATATIIDNQQVVSSLKVMRRENGDYVVDISRCTGEKWPASKATGLDVVEILGGPEQTTPLEDVKKVEETEQPSRRIRKMNLGQ